MRCNLECQYEAKIETLSKAKIYAPSTKNKHNSQIQRHFKGPPLSAFEGALPLKEEIWRQVDL